MFRKKDKAKADSAADIQLRKLLDHYYEAFNLLQNKTERAIVSNGVIELYSYDSLDRKIAEINCTKAKSAMVEAIRDYDSAKDSYNKFFCDHYEELVNMKDYRKIELTPYRIVEQVWERFFK